MSRGPRKPKEQDIIDLKNMTSLRFVLFSHWFSPRKALTIGAAHGIAKKGVRMLIQTTGFVLAGFFFWPCARKIYPSTKFIQPQLWYFQSSGWLSHWKIFSDTGVATREKCGVRHIVLQTLDQELYPTADVSARLDVKSNLQPKHVFVSTSKRNRIAEGCLFRNKVFSTPTSTS